MTDDEDLINKIEETTVDATRRQLDTLSTILYRNGAVGYLNRYIHYEESAPTPAIDADSFRRLVPLTTYDDYAAHINLIADGIPDNRDGDDDRRRFLSVDPLVCFFLSSGTTGMKPKLIPYYDSPPSNATSYLSHLGSGAILRRSFPPRPSINKTLWFIYAGNVTVTKGGCKAMAATALPLSGNKESQTKFLSTCIAPLEVVMGSNLQHQMYCHLLCGLRRFELIDAIRAPYAIGLIRAFSLLQAKWEQLCDDLQHGVVSPEITDSILRDSVTDLLGGPQMEIANRVQSICREKSWVGILAKLWPNARYIRCITTGSMQQYYKKLKHFAGEIPLLGGDYFASECCVGINLDIMQPPELTRFVMLPTAAYFEFLPFNLSHDDLFSKETVDFSGVEVGKMYEVVVTTYRGLYRYRLGDIVKVVGFHNLSPKVEFIMRAPKNAHEIITERDLIRAVGNLELAVLGSLSNGEIIEFACFLELELATKQIMIFVEFASGCELLLKEKENESISFLRSCCSTVEDGLGGMFRLKREAGEVGPLMLSLVHPGTFDLLIHKAVENNAPASQYKLPKIIRSRKIADFMEANAAFTV